MPFCHAACGHLLKGSFLSEAANLFSCFPFASAKLVVFFDSAKFFNTFFLFARVSSFLISYSLAYSLAESKGSW